MPERRRAGRGQAFRSVVAGLLLAVAVALPSAHGEELPRLALRAQATVDSREVLLRDIAEIIAPEGLRGRLEQVSLGSGPVPGTQRTIKEDYIKLRLRRFGVDPRGVEVTGGPVLVVSGRSPQAVVRPLPAVAPSGAAAVAGVADGGPGEAAVPPLVKRGQLVAVTVTCGGVTIHGSGRAVADAGQDELTKVTLEGTKRVLVVRVVGPGETVCLLARSTP